jgi:predicted nucleic acid-binding protein
VALIALDTDVSSLIIKDKLPATMAGRLVGNKLAISFVTLGELTKWVEVRQWGPHRRTRLDAFRRDKFIMLGDEDIALRWGRLAAAAQRDGQPRPANDSWIAACCLVYGIPLATFNIKDYLYFKDEHGLTLVA